MRSRVLLAIAVATVLRGVPSFASAAEVAIPDPSPWEGAAIPLAAGAATATLAGVVLLLAARRRTASGSADGTAAAIDATEDEAVAAALQRRAVRRGRVRIEDEPSPDPGEPPRGARRMDDSD
ncbi:MAG: hypothetical protein ACRDFY_01810 [Candidatus Limnocylindria bacterium]